MLIPQTLNELDNHSKPKTSHSLKETADQASALFCSLRQTLPVTEALTKPTENMCGLAVSRLHLMCEVNCGFPCESVLQGEERQ